MARPSLSPCHRIVFRIRETLPSQTRQTPDSALDRVLRRGSESGTCDTVKLSMRLQMPSTRDAVTASGTSLKAFNASDGRMTLCPAWRKPSMFRAMVSNILCANSGCASSSGKGAHRCVCAQCLSISCPNTSETLSQPGSPCRDRRLR